MQQSFVLLQPYSLQNFYVHFLCKILYSVSSSAHLELEKLKLIASIYFYRRITYREGIR